MKSNTHSRTRYMVTAALFAALITVLIVYIFHIPIPTGGYIHLGDTMIFFAACLLPTPYAIFAGSVGAGLADLLTAPIWALPTLIIKAIVVSMFTSKSEKFICKRNIIALIATLFVSPTLYSLAQCVMAKNWAAFVAQFPVAFVSIGASILIFLVAASILDKMNFKEKISKYLNG